MISRRRTREYLLQMLYARACTPTTFDRDIFFRSYFEEGDATVLDAAYIDAVEASLLENEDNLLAIIEWLAPKFELSTLPAIHLIILMISLTEILYIPATLEPIPESVSVNEAIELAKRFSDTQGKGFINGALSTFLKGKEDILKNTKPQSFHLFTL